MLAQRLRGEAARPEPALLFATTALAALVAWRLLGRALDPAFGLWLTAGITAVFAGHAVSNTREALTALVAAEPAPVPAIE